MTDTPVTPPSPSQSRSQMLVTALTVLLALLLAAAVVTSTSRAAFTATTANTGDSFSTGSINLTDDDAGVALFNATGLTGGQVITQCIAVTYTGSLTPATVKLYGTAAGALAPYLTLQVQDGTGGGFGNCAGFTASSTLFNAGLDTFSSTYVDYSTGLSAFVAAGSPTTRVFKFTVTVSSSAAAANKTATAAFTWEAQA